MHRPSASQAEQSIPVRGRQRQHQQQAERDTQGRDDWHERAAEGPLGSGLVRRMISTAPQTTTKANRVPMFVRCQQGVNGEKRRQGSDEDADENRADPRRLEGGVDTGEDAARHQPVAAIARKTRGH